MNYILLFDHTQVEYDSIDIHRFIKDSRMITDWWHYLPNAYIVSTTELNSKKMTASIVSAYPGLRFFISKLDLSDYNGVLNKSAWEWLKTKTNKLLRIKPAPKSRPITLNELFNSNKSITRPDTMMEAIDTLIEKAKQNKK